MGEVGCGTGKHRGHLKCRRPHCEKVVTIRCRGSEYEGKGGKNQEMATH
jgi:hypothetical protein